MKEIKTSAKLQFFSGFYESIWSSDSGINDHDYTTGERYDEDYTFDEDAYEKEIGRQVADIYADWVEEHVSKEIKIEYDGITSPAYYNYSTDSIDVIITINEQAKADILAKIQEHKEVLAKWINRDCSDYPGYWSWLSNDINDWNEQNLFDTEEYHQPAYLSAILDYIIKAEWKKNGWSTDMNETAYYECETCVEGFMTPKNKAEIGEEELELNTAE